MRTLKGLTALITGASSGIGRATALAFAGAGAELIVVARREERLRELCAEIQAAFDVNVQTVGLDVRNRNAVTSTFDTLGDTKIDILVNNAGLSRGLAPLQSGDLDDWDEMIDTNVKGLLYVTRALTPAMVERGRGHVINVGSIAGHEVYANGSVYCASKHAVHALTQGLRMDLHGTGIRVSTIDPGLVETEFSVVRFHGDKERADSVYADTRPLTAEDVADAILYAATCPDHVNVAELILLASDQSTATTIDRSRGTER